MFTGLPGGLSSPAFMEINFYCRVSTVGQPFKMTFLSFYFNASFAIAIRVVKKADKRRF